MAELLANPSEVEERLGVDLTSEQLHRLAALIQDASAAVRSEAGGQYISRATSTIRTSLGGRFALPQHPVVSITSVNRYDGTIVGGVGTAIDHTWDGLNTLDLTGTLNGWEINGVYSNVAIVTYVHGYDPVPDDIVAVVSQMAGRAFGLPSSDAGVTQESLGAYSVSYGIAAASGGVGFLPDERTIVQRYRRPRAPISMLT